MDKRSGANGPHPPGSMAGRLFPLTAHRSPLTAYPSPLAKYSSPHGHRYLWSMSVQIFGTRKSAETRAALRFFAERRTPVHFVDLLERPASPGELRRFVQKFGVDALVDRQGRRFAELGLRSASYGEDRWLALLAEEPLLLRQPLVRNGAALSIGQSTDTWKEWLGK